MTSRAPIGGVLHGVSLSPFVRKVRSVLGLKGIDYELVMVMPGAMDPAFRALSPLAKIPVWQEEGFTLPDSSAICAYLDRCVPSPAIYPESPRAFGTALFWEEYVDTRGVETTFPIFFQRIVQAAVFGKPSDEEQVRRQIEDVLPAVFDQIETLFIERDGADPRSPGIAELSVWSLFVSLAHADVEPDAAQWPGLAGFVAEMGAHPILRPLVEEERASLAAHRAQAPH